MDSASRALANMEKKGFLYKIKTYKGTGGYVYFTTNKGAEFALACIGKDSYTINEKGEQIATFRTQKDNKYNKSFLKHAISISDVYYYLLSTFGYGNFLWELENDSYITTPGNKSFVRYDAGFQVNGKKYILEIDLGSESKAAIQKKFTKYANSLDDQIEYPNLIFIIDYENTIDESNINMDSELKKIRDRINEIENEIEHLELTISISEIYNKYGNEGINDRIIELKNKLIDPSEIFSLREINKMKKELKLLNDYEEYDYLHPYEIIEELDTIKKWKAKVHNLNEELCATKQKIINNLLNWKYHSRINMIKNIIISNHSLNRLAREGMNINIISKTNFQEIVKLKILQNKEDYASVLTEILMTKANLNSPRLLNNQAILIEGTNVFIKNFIVFRKSAEENGYFIVDDLSNGNIGGIARLNYINECLVGKDYSRILNILLVVDNNHHAKLIDERLKDVYGLKANYRYINKEDVNWKDQSSVLNKIYSINS